VTRTAPPLAGLLVLLLAMASAAGEFAAAAEFAQKPRVTRRGDNVTITFTVAAYCDVTVAIEDADGRIVRHLASGVLGKNAPPPFRKNSRSQTVVWDGKDDRGIYLDDKEQLTVRVSLGLKAEFERSLFWSPHKAIGGNIPSICVAREGVYVYGGYAVDHVRLFDHDGNYVRTTYPFPANQIDGITGLAKYKFPQDGRTRPLKLGFHQATLLTSGTNNNVKSSAEGVGASTIAAHNGVVAVAHQRLNRLNAGRLPLAGPKTTFLMKLKQAIHARTTDFPGPISSAFSPDGKYLYLTGWVWNSGQRYIYDWVHGVGRIEFGKDGPMKLFAGSFKQDDIGKDAKHLTVPSSVACDAKGRVYVSDFVNSRIQVFTPDGKLFKSISTPFPARVDVHRRTGEIYVFSWLLITRYKTPEPVRATYTRMGPVENPKVITRCELPLAGYSPTRSWNNSGGLPFRMAVDSWADEPSIWIVPGAARWLSSGNGSVVQNWKSTGIKLLVEKKGKLVVKRDFGTDTVKAVKRTKPPILWRQRLYVNPTTGKLYIGEGDSGVMKTFNDLIEVDPRTGRCKIVQLPFGSEDMCFGIDGMVYLRTDRVVGRYRMDSWREVPWDYGEKIPAAFGMGTRNANLIAGLPTPGHRSNPFWHMGGMDISAKGRLLISTCNLLGMNAGRKENWHKRSYTKFEGKPYTPKMYPGRARWGEMHVWDRRGKVVYEDAVPGMGHMNGVGIDTDDHIYMLVAGRQLVDGKARDPNLSHDVSSVLVRVKAKKAKVIGTTRRAPVPLPEKLRPKRPPDIRSKWTGAAWVQGADWFFGGVGFDATGCVCWNSRFDLDYFNRSFAPEPLMFSVAILDANGNLITRVGKYGNIDDKGMGIVHACYVATHTDRRLFIADAGNARVLSAKLTYQATETIPLKDVPDTRGR
jgi:NHL repeat-containing protein